MIAYARCMKWAIIGHHVSHGGGTMPGVGCRLGGIAWGLAPPGMVESL
jgi:hypothetical protein